MSYFVYLNFKKIISEEELSNFNIIKKDHSTNILTSVIGTEWFFIGDGHSSQNIIKKSFFNQKEVTLSDEMISFFRELHVKGHYPSLLVKLEGRDKKAKNFNPKDRIKIPIDSLVNDYIFKEEIRYVLY